MKAEWLGMAEGLTITSDVDDSIIAIEYEITRKLKAVKQTEQKTELSENEKIKISREYDLIRNVRKLIRSFRQAMKSNLGKIPPSAVDLEETILGAIIIEKLAFQAVGKFLEPEHFYKESHSVIYSAIQDLHKESIPIDLRSVVMGLRKSGQIDLIGGAPYIVELTTKVSSSANIEYHARVVVEFAIKRRLIMMSAHLLMNAYDDTADCFEIFNYAEKEINHIGEWRKK